MKPDPVLAVSFFIRDAFEKKETCKQFNLFILVSISRATSEYPIYKKVHYQFLVSGLDLLNIIFIQVGI